MREAHLLVQFVLCLLLTQCFLKLNIASCIVRPAWIDAEYLLSSLFLLDEACTGLVYLGCKVTMHVDQLTEELQ